MIKTIENEFFKISVDSFGGQLINMVGKKSNTEFIWQRNKDYWEKCAPILFPIVGRLANGEYSLDGKKYQMSSHGFAAEFDYKLEKHTDQSIVFSLENNGKTFSQYPFLFKLYVEFILKEKELTVNYTVENKDVKEIYFSIGAHPAFNVPLYEGENFSDYYIQLEKKETAQIFEINEQFMFFGNKVDFLKNENIINLNYDLFATDALVFENLESQFAYLKSNKNDFSLKFGFKDFPYFALWTKKDSGFICFEPWFGHADFSDFSGTFLEKQGMQCLNVDKTFVCTHTIEINENCNH